MSRRDIALVTISDEGSAVVVERAVQLDHDAIVGEPPVEPTVVTHVTHVAQRRNLPLSDS